MVQFNQVRGFGFIAPDDGGDDVFVHSEEARGHAGELRVGTRVEFRVMEGQRGLKAYDVKVLPETGPSAAPTRIGHHSPAPAADDEDSWEIISEREYEDEVTNVLVTQCPDITAAQIVATRQRLVQLARKRGWIDD